MKTSIHLLLPALCSSLICGTLLCGAPFVQAQESAVTSGSAAGQSSAVTVVTEATSETSAKESAVEDATAEETPDSEVKDSEVKDSQAKDSDATEKAIEDSALVEAAALPATKKDTQVKAPPLELSVPAFRAPRDSLGVALQYSTYFSNSKADYTDSNFAPGFFADLSYEFLELSPSLQLLGGLVYSYIGTETYAPALGHTEQHSNLIAAQAVLRYLPISRLSIEALAGAGVDILDLSLQNYSTNSSYSRGYGVFTGILGLEAKYHFLGGNVKERGLGLYLGVGCSFLMQPNQDVYLKSDNPDSGDSSIPLGDYNFSRMNTRFMLGMSY